MASTNQLRFDGLDFDQIKDNLKAFLQSQPDFSDYNFEGSGITQILNLLAYNTAYNAVLANASFNETFLDTAVKRSSVVSRAKEMNYLPKSAKCARAMVDIRVTSPSTVGAMITLDRYSQFTSTAGGSTFSFYNIQPFSTTSAGGEYLFEDVELFEGQLVTNSFTVANNQTQSDTRFALLNASIDVDTIQVVVQQSSTDTSISTFQLATDITNVTSTSNVYYLQQNSAGYYEIYFGDGVLGQQLAVGNVVRVTYLVTSADAANVASGVTQTFTPVNPIGGTTDVIVSTTTNSNGGDVEESVDSIKFNAPLALTRNSRTVTAPDYWSVVTDNMPSVDSVNVYGGEDAVPPVYGKVFISVKPKSGYLVPSSVKDDIVALLRETNIVTIVPEFVDPDFTFLTFDIEVQYDQTSTTLSAPEMNATVQTAVQNFFDQFLGKFRNPFYFSKMSRTIDECNDAIQGNVTKFYMQKRFDPIFSQPFYVSFNYGIGVKPGSLFSNVFLYQVADTQSSVYMQDDGNGSINLIDFSTTQPVKTGIGSINYATGAINISNLVLVGFVSGEAQLKISMSPEIEVSNVLPVRNQIIMVDDSTQNQPANVLAGVTINCTPST